MTGAETHRGRHRPALRVAGSIGAGIGAAAFALGIAASPVPAQPALRVASLQQIDRRSVVHLAAFARSMSPGSASCNTTPDEDFAEALQAAVDSPWRQGSELRSIVLISDNPAHAHLRDQAVADAREFSNRPGARHTVSTVFVTGQDSARRSYPDTAVFMRQVALAGKGEFVRSSESASLSVTILRAIFG